MELELSGKVTLVIEVNRAARAAIASRLAREAAHLCLMISDSAKLREIADTLTKAANIAVRVFSADLRDPAEPGQAIAQAVGHFGRLDPPVNNAGASRHADLFARTDEDWQDGFAMKFHGNVSVTRAAGPHSRCSNGSIVNRA